MAQITMTERVVSHRSVWNVQTYGVQVLNERFSVVSLQVSRWCTISPWTDGEAQRGGTRVSDISCSHDDSSLIFVSSDYGVQYTDGMTGACEYI